MVFTSIHSLAPFIDLQPPPSEIIPWFINQFINLIYIFFIVCLLVTSLEILKLVGIEKLFLKIFTVPLKILWDSKRGYEYNNSRHDFGYTIWRRVIN